MPSFATARVIRIVGSAGGVAVLAALGACAQPEMTADIRSDVPQERLLGLAEASKNNDPSAAKEYVVMLDSGDPAVRMFAIGALKRMTGETKGYDFAAPEHVRAPAVSAWAKWIEEGGAEPGAAPGGSRATP